jgi:hypothetical protein
MIFMPCWCRPGHGRWRAARVGHTEIQGRQGTAASKPAILRSQPPRRCTFADDPSPSPQQLKTEVDGSGRMGQRPGADEIHTALCDVPNVFHSDPTRCLQQSAGAIARHRIP